MGHSTKKYASSKEQIRAPAEDDNGKVQPGLSKPSGYETVSKLDLSEIQEENPVCKPTKSLQTTDRVN